MLIFLKRLQALAFNGSTGHGAFLVCQIKNPLTNNNKPEIMNNNILYLESTIKKGRLDTIPARIAPAPNATNKEGKAQQRSVPKLVNRLREGMMRFLDEIGFILTASIYCLYRIPSIFKNTRNCVILNISLFL